MHLTVETGKLAGTQVALDRHHPVTIGSAEGCGLCLREPGVAGEHAVVKALRDDGFGVKALAKGLRLNGREVEAAPLHDGDVLEFGNTRLVYGKVREHGPQVTGFKILGELGRGGMGMVYRAEQQSLHRQVALKVLDKKRTDDPQFVAKFVAEARAAAKLGHPNVVHVFDVGQDGDTYYYSMELMHHGSLEGWLKKHGRMPVDRALQVVAEAATGLAYAESLRIVHRDIKPDNLMLDQHGTCKIADLGLAFTEEVTEEHLTGTPHFMAPEQVLRKSLDHRTDLYALGCTFYRLVTGKTPFRGPAVKDILRAHVRDTAELAHKVESTVPTEVSAIIAKLMAKEPGDRFQSANELIAAVTAMLAPPARRGLWIGLAAAGVVVAGGAVWWAVTRPKEQQVVELYRDNPEAQRLAIENGELKKEKKEDKATIALQRAQLEAGTGLPLANALDEVALAHAGTAAATRAKELADTERSALAAQQVQQQRSHQLAADAVAAIRTQVDAAIVAQDLPRALALATGPVPPEGADAAAFATGISVVRGSVVTAAREHTAGLQRAIADAEQKGDDAALQRGGEALQRLCADGGWPEALLPNRTELRTRAEAALRGATNLQATRTAALWREYSVALHGESGVAGLLATARLGAAADRFAAFSAEASTPMAVRAAQWTAALRHGEGFAAALAAAAARGELQWSDAETPLAVGQWRRDEGQFVLLDQHKKPPKESTVAAADVSLEQWQALAQQVAEDPSAAGSRACFLAAMAVQRHFAAARGYLKQVRADNDESGTGNGGYPLGFDGLDTLLQRLPKNAAWSECMRDELAGAQLLAAGLRALSERRNMAAASYLERALAEHPHSLCVSGLP